MKIVTYQNLFGEERQAVMSEAKRKPTERRGYAWHPGTGPDGETCGTCEFAVRRRRWAKCGHNSAPRHTGGMGTDIRLRAPACKFWEKKQ